MVKERVSEVSQSGLTQELNLGVSLEFEVEFLSMEDFTEREWNGVRNGEEVEVEGMGLRRGDERWEREEREYEQVQEQDMVQNGLLSYRFDRDSLISSRLISRL